MITGLIICFVYILSMVGCACIFMERRVDPNPISVFIVLCPIINTIYCIYRSTSFIGNWESWFKNL